MLMLNYQVTWINKLPFREILTGTPNHKNKSKPFFF